MNAVQTAISRLSALIVPLSAVICGSSAKQPVAITRGHVRANSSAAASQVKTTPIRNSRPLEIRITVIRSQKDPTEPT